MKFVTEVSRDLESHEIVASRDNRRVVRVRIGDETVIVKFWIRPGFRGAVRRYLGSTMAHREFRALNLFMQLGVPVPEPLGFVFVPANPCNFTEAVVMSDLGKCEQAVKYFGDLVLVGTATPIRAFEDRVIDITVRMLEGGVLDFDHGLINMVVPASGHPVRLDLEHAKVYRVHSLRPKLRARMLGRLLLTHLFAVQPAGMITEEFSRRLFDAVRVSARARVVIADYIAQALERQLSDTGLKVEFELPRQ